MNWHQLTTEEQLEQIKTDSKLKPQLIFKHSTRCNISSMALNRLNRETNLPDIEYHLLDLIAYRSLSQKIAEDLQVQHESPQVLLIRNGECVYDESHSGISVSEIAEQVAQLN